jgi:hypothetical protein
MDTQEQLRQERAREILAKPGAVRLDGASGIAVVESQTTPGRLYLVNLRQMTCTCTDFERRHLPCKHILAAYAMRERQVQATRAILWPSTEWD